MINSKFNRFLVLLVGLLTMCVTQVWAEDDAINLAGGSFANSKITWTGTACTIVQEKVSGSTAVGSSYIAAPRWYAGHKISFTAKTGYTITGATIICGSNAYATAIKDGTYSAGASGSASGTTVTITSTGNFTVTLAAQSRPTSITVHYIAAGAKTLALASTSIDFGTVTQNASVAAQTVRATLTNVTSATAALSGAGASAFSISPTNLTSTGDITITPVTTSVGTYEATLTLSATGAESKTATISMNVEAPFDGTIATLSAANDADIKFVTGSSSTDGAIWANSSPLSDGNITLSGSVTSGTNYSYYDGSVVRFYANNNIVITPKAGVTIKKIEIIRQSTTSSNTGTINCSGLTASGENTTTNTNVYTGSTTTAVTFTNNAQCRFTAIRVYYTGSAGPTTYTASIADPAPSNGSFKLNHSTSTARLLPLGGGLVCFKRAFTLL